MFSPPCGSKNGAGTTLQWVLKRDRAHGLVQVALGAADSHLSAALGRRGGTVLEEHLSVNCPRQPGKSDSLVSPAVQKDTEALAMDPIWSISSDLAPRPFLVFPGLS